MSQQQNKTWKQSPVVLSADFFFLSKNTAIPPTTSVSIPRVTKKINTFH